MINKTFDKKWQVFTKLLRASKLEIFLENFAKTSLESAFKIRSLRNTLSKR